MFHHEFTQLCTRLFTAVSYTHLDVYKRQKYTWPRSKGRKKKFQELIDDLDKKQIFGKVAAYVYTIEFQKRGLPHMDRCV